MAQVFWPHSSLNMNECWSAQTYMHPTGILTQMATWNFVFHLILFFKLLGITNGLSQMLQSEALDLADAICLVGATLKTLNDYRKEEKYMQISDDAKELADSLNIPVMESQRRSHHTRTPSSRLRDMIVLESTGNCTFEGEDVDKATYFAVVDKFIVEIKARFNDSEHILIAIAACNPKVANFLDLKLLTPNYTL